MRNAIMLLAGAGAAGALIWLATRVTGDAIDTAGDYWVSVALLAAAGFMIAALNMLGRAGNGAVPTVSVPAFVLGFVPVFIAAGFVVWYGQPDGGWLVADSHSFADNIGIGGLVDDLTRVLPVFPFGIGLVLGLTFAVAPRHAARTVTQPQRTAFAPAGTTNGHRQRDTSTSDRGRDADVQEAPTHPLSREKTAVRG